MAERTRSRRTTAGRGGQETASGRLKRNYSDEEYREPGEGYNGPQPSRGLYTAELFDVRDHTTGEGNESIRWGFRLVPGSEDAKTGDDVSGFADFLYTNDNTLWREQQILVATGVIKPNGQLNLTYEQILKKAKPCTVKMGQERYVPEDGEPEWRGRMQAFLPPKDGAAKTTRRKAKDEDVDESEFEEEATEDAEESDWPEDPDELAEALEELSLAELKKVAREDFSVKISRGMDKEDIVESVLDTLEESADEPEEDEPEEEPEPPKRSTRSRRSKPQPEDDAEDEDEDEEPEKPARTRRTRAAAGGRSARSRRSSKGTDDEPPF